MNDGAAILQAILDDPADDLPRLAYADWLEESGGDLARAELVRVQIRLHRLRFGQGEQAFLQEHIDSLQQRESELIEKHSLSWFDSDDWRFHGDWYGIGFVKNGDGTTNHGGWHDNKGYILADMTRGFVSHITCTLAEWEQHGPALCATQPVTRVELTDREPVEDANGWNWGHRARYSPTASFSTNRLARARLPVPIWKALEGGTLGKHFRWYKSKGAAEDALSAALLLMAKPQPAPA